MVWFASSPLWQDLRPPHSALTTRAFGCNKPTCNKPHASAFSGFSLRGREQGKIPRGKARARGQGGDAEGRARAAEHRARSAQRQAQGIAQDHPKRSHQGTVVYPHLHMALVNHTFTPSRAPPFRGNSGRPFVPNKTPPFSEARRSQKYDKPANDMLLRSGTISRGCTSAAFPISEGVRSSARSPPMPSTSSPETLRR